MLYCLKGISPKLFKIMESENKKENKKEDFEKEHGELKKMLKEVVEVSIKNQEDLKYIRRFILWLQVWGAIKLVIILVPIILGIIYLPPFLKEWVGSYQEVLFGSEVRESHQKGVVLDVFAK